MNKYKVAYMINNSTNSLVVEADYYVREDGFVDFMVIEDQVMSIKTEYVISITKI